MRCIIASLLVLNTSLASGKDVTVNGRQFSIPDGFILELAAARPLTERPIHIDFDSKGRLYISESSGSNDNVRIQQKEKPHSILRLEDTNNDGVFDKRTTFAKDMMLPEGALFYDGSFYVGAPPEIWKLTDTDDDGVADKREVWFDAKTLNGCANDLHGPYLGPDGWIYWCKGAFEKQTYERPGKEPLITRAAHMFRRRPEGGPVEAVMTGGMDNPVEVAFSPGGERFFSTTFLHHPHGNKRDGVIHALYGGVYGKNHGVLEGHPRTGDLLPELINMGAAAPCGMAWLQTDGLGTSFKNSLLVCQFNKHKVSRHRLKRHGATFESEEVPFVSSPDLDFHPTDVLEDADGSLLIVDTGGWYKLCCPTSQLYKPDIPGAIYRLRKEGSTRKRLRPSPRDLSTKSVELAISGSHTDRKEATLWLSKLKGKAQVRAVNQLMQGFESRSESERINTVWALSHLDHTLARAKVREALRDESTEVRSAAAHVASVWQDTNALPGLHHLLKSDHLIDRRVAAEAVGRIGGAKSVPAILEAAAFELDRATEHSLIFALIEIGAVKQTRIGIPSSHASVLRVQHVALDQMKDGALDPAKVVALLDSQSETLVDTAWWLLARNEEWVGSITKWFDEQLGNETAVVRQHPFPARLALFANNQRVQQIMANALQQGRPSTQIAVLKAIEDRVGMTPGDPLQAGIRKALQSGNSDVVEQAIQTTRSVADKLNAASIERIQWVADSQKLPAMLRLQALATTAIALKAARRQQLRLNKNSLEFVSSQLDLNVSPSARAAAVDVIVASDNEDSLGRIASALPSTGPMELRRLLAVFERHRSEETGALLVRALSQSPATSTFDPIQLRARLAKFGPKTAKAAQPLIARITKENKTKLARLNAVLDKVEQADERRGQLIFHSSKTSCIACHQMGYLGGRIGPSLNRIGNIRSERDLLESILFPSASFVRSFEPVTIVTHGGKVYNGVVKDETSQHIVLSLDAKRTMQISTADIEVRKPGTTSIMPAGLDKQLSDQEFADLIRFLKVSR